MARPDREERQQRRWLEDARKYLARGDLESALPLLLRLPAPLREEVLPQGAALFRKTVWEQHQRGAWGPLSALAARADAEPGLVERGAEAEQARATYWPLVWAAGRAREWDRAQRLWSPLADTARTRAPRLAMAVDTWLSSRGVLPAEGLAPILACLPAVDPRLGVERTRVRATLPPPGSVAQVEEAVLALCAIEPFPVFSSRVGTWAREAPAEVAQAVWQLAGQLAARELWIRAVAGKGGAALWEPAVLLARALREAGAPPVLAAPVLQALRLVSSGLPREGLSRSEEAEVWCALAHAAALQPEARTWVIRAVAEVRCSGAALPRVLRLYEDLLALAPEAALWARAFLAWCERQPEAPSAPRWLEEGLRRLLSTELPALRAWLRAAEPSEREELADGVASTCEPHLVEEWVDALWEKADEELRRVLSGAISVLLDRSRLKSSGRRLDSVLRGARNEEDVLRLLMEEEGMLEQAQAAMKLPPEGLRTWHRFASRVLPYQVELLEVAVREASSDTEASQAGTRYLEAHPGDRGYVEVLRTMALCGYDALAKRFLAQWLERRAGDVQALAGAVTVADRMSTPCQYLHAVLEAFLQVLAEQPPSGALTEVVQEAKEVAREHGYRLRKRRAPRKKTERSKAPRKSKGSGRS